jgi:plastocyanin
MIEDIVNDLVEFSATFVIPDWGELIALLPIFLLVPVVLYLVWLIVRLANAGPTRRGKRRLEPAPPAGIHMPGPSFAPFLAAVGALFLVFGMVAGGIWLLVGGVILTITLLYWGREALRDYDQIPAASGEAPVTGMLPAPAGTPPPGVHIPPPSFRPLLVSIAATILVAGLVIGGWALFLGFVALVITMLGWLWDSRREYRAVEEADRTGHLDLGGSPAWPKGTFAALAVLVVFALALSSGILGGATTSETGGEAAVPSAGTGGEPGGGGEAPASEAPALPEADAVITALNIEYTTKDVTVPAGAPFTIAFDNQDPVPHDVVIKDGGGATVFQGDIITGPAVVVYDVPAIPAGSYSFVCSVHPNMTGSITAQ